MWGEGRVRVRPSPNVERVEDEIAAARADRQWVNVRKNVSIHRRTDSRFEDRIDHPVANRAADAVEVDGFLTETGTVRRLRSALDPRAWRVTTQTQISRKGRILIDDRQAREE